MPLTLTDDNFDQEVLQSSVPVLVDFWAPWCGPCQMMGPIIAELAAEYDASKIKVGKLNVDDNQMTSGKYEVMSIPTFFVFKNGEVAEQIVGGVPKEKLKAILDRFV